MKSINSWMYGMNLHSNTADGQLILPGRPEITVQLRPSRRASRLSLRISRLKGQVTLSLPLSCPMAPAKSFILEKETNIFSLITLGLLGFICTFIYDLFFVLFSESELTHEISSLKTTAARLKFKGIDGGLHKRWSMWFNSKQRAEPYQSLQYTGNNCYKLSFGIQALHGCRQFVA